MRAGGRDKSSTIERIRYRLAADKKKAVTAMCLVGVMAFMWGRLLLKKGPDDAHASPNVGEAVEAQGGDQDVHVSYVELPSIPGRNDVITRDFFSSAGWRGFSDGSETEDSTGRENVEVVSDGGSEEIARAIASGLELQAVRDGGQPRAQAFINDKLVVEGSILKVNSGDGTYECEVVEIEENRVCMQYGEVKVILKLKGS